MTDTGTGIAPEMLPHIFQPWVTTKSAGQGTGLGLSITRDVVSRLGGTVSASSTQDAAPPSSSNCPSPDHQTLMTDHAHCTREC